MPKSTQYDTIKTSVYYDEDDSVWCWDIQIGSTYTREGEARTRKDALDAVNDAVEAAL